MKAKPEAISSEAERLDGSGLKSLRSQELESARRISRMQIGALAVGAAALDGLAVGAVALGQLAIGRLAVGHARIRRLEIDEPTVSGTRIIPRPPKPVATSHSIANAAALQALLLLRK